MQINDIQTILESKGLIDIRRKIWRHIRRYLIRSLENKWEHNDSITKGTYYIWLDSEQDNPERVKVIVNAYSPKSAEQDKHIQVSCSIGIY